MGDAEAFKVSGGLRLHGVPADSSAATPGCYGARRRWVGVPVGTGVHPVVVDVGGPVAVVARWACKKRRSTGLVASWMARS